MSKTRIFAIGSHATKERMSGVDFARIVQPAEHLNKVDGFEVTVYDPKSNETMDWAWVAENHDIIFFNYTAKPWEFAKMGLLARKNNRLLVMDVDDSLWDIMPDNPVYESFKRGSEAIRNFTSICNEVDYITTTNKYLRNVISHNTNKHPFKIKVLPNFIDMDNLYTHRTKFKDTGEIRLLNFGSTTHFLDLQSEAFENGIDKVMKTYPNVVFKTVGALIPKYKYKWGQRYENSYGHQDLYKWVNGRFPMFMDETDIFVTPLAENRYTKCKSSIKFLEASSAIKAGVWQRIRQYEQVVDGKNGLTAYSADDWFNTIKTLIEDKKLRKEMGNNAFNTVKRDWQMKNNVGKYAQLFIDILAR